MKTLLITLTLCLLCSPVFAHEESEALSPQAPIDVTDITLTPVPSPTPLDEVQVKEVPVVTPLVQSTSEIPLTAPAPALEQKKSVYSFDSRIKVIVNNISNAIKGTCVERAEVLLRSQEDGQIVVADKVADGGVKLIISNKPSDSCK